MRSNVPSLSPTRAGHALGMCAAKDRAIALPLSCKLGADGLGLSRSHPLPGLKRAGVWPRSVATFCGFGLIQHLAAIATA